MGLTPAYGKLLGWLLICDPPQQTSGELAAALDLSKGSVSTGMRLLERSGFVRRVPVPGRRGHAYEVAPDAIIRTVVEPTRFRVFRELMDRGVQLAGGPDAPRADRVRITRDFYAYVERELPALVERFRADQRKGAADA
ncbi:GbsR/MarR family transcriptional regulator [Plantactinospora sp. WMMB782]|uniref:GbsR/MarR family transcriptional regulator n=1 Tax=Plantactinospora sp. WMMB782 TaxID=3404121 RepID=UPI003B95D04E